MTSRAKPGWDVFGADAAHELQTPSTAIRGYAELFRRGGLTDSTKLQAAMARVEGESARMGTLVDDLLLITMIDGRQPLRRSRTNIADLAADAVSVAESLEPSRQLTLHVEPTCLPSAMPSASVRSWTVG